MAHYRRCALCDIDKDRREFRVKNPSMCYECETALLDEGNHIQAEIDGKVRKPDNLWALFYNYAKGYCCEDCKPAIVEHRGKTLEYLVREKLTCDYCSNYLWDLRDLLLRHAPCVR
jgi:hypothetical protein